MNRAAMALTITLCGIQASELPRANSTTGSGKTTFTATTNMPGLAIHGKSNILTASADIRNGTSGLIIDRFEARTPVKMLTTGMALRDQHMRDRVLIASGSEGLDLTFVASGVLCPPLDAGREIACEVRGEFTLRGVARPLKASAKIREQDGAFHVVANAMLKLSDYGIEPPSQFGVRVEDQVQFHVEFVTAGGGQ